MDIKGFKTKDGVVYKYDHEALANIPEIPSQEGYAKESWVQNNYQPKGDYLESTKLTEAVNAALTQAKKSGEFDGENGEDGGYYTPSVTQPEAEKLQIDFTPSRSDMPAVQPVTVDLPVPDSDRESIVQDVITALGTPVFGTVDEENNIILTGELADGTYTLKYEHADGNVTIIGTLEHGMDLPAYTNQIPISTDTDGSIYNGTGYAVAKRISSSGAIKDIGNLDATMPLFVTGFIPVKTGDIIRMKNCFIDAAGKNNGVDTYGNVYTDIPTVFFDSNKAEIGRVTWYNTLKANSWIACTVNAEDLVTEFTVTGENIAYVRLNPAPTGNVADAIITVNEVIE